MVDSADSPEPRPDPRLPQTRSGRRLTPLRQFLYRAAVVPAMALVRLWWWWSPIVKVVGAEHVEAAIAAGPAMPVYWHQHQLFIMRYLMSLRRPGFQLGVAISPSVDGEIPALLAQRGGVRVLRGSSTYEGARALRDYFVALREGVTLALTPDGPTGPRYRMKPGPIVLAQMSGRPMLPIAYAASKAWKFRTWDRFVLPRPGARIAIAVGAPRYVPKATDVEGQQRLMAEIEQELLALYRAARSALA